MRPLLVLSAVSGSASGLWALLVVNPAVAPHATAAAGRSLNHDIGWILLTFAIFTIYMLVLTSQLNTAVFLVFLALQLTVIVLFIGNFNAAAALRPTGDIKASGYIGLVTAARRLVHLGGTRRQQASPAASSSCPVGPAADQLTLIS